MFGTLYVPAAEREPLDFGVEPDREAAHTIWGELIAPLGRAVELVKGRLVPRSAPAAALPATERNETY